LKLLKNIQRADENGYYENLVLAQKTGRATNYKLWKDGYPVLLDTLEKIEQRVTIYL
jgi:hypothetical protein